MNLAPADGYNVSTAYTYNYFKRLSPSWLRMVSELRGVPFPGGESFRYFELGFGQGVSLNVHAVANDGEFWGNDYIPEHVDFAQRMANFSGANLTLLGDSFEQLAERTDLPQFHVVVAHGIWAWISDSTRAAILRFLDRNLAPGGLFYVSYNALPGSASGIATQRFLSATARAMDPALPEKERFDRARAMLGAVIDEPNSHFAHYDRARRRLQGILDRESPYLLHEYMVESWRPELLCDVARTMATIGLTLAGSAEVSGADVAELFEPSAADADRVTRGTLLDFETDNQFRWDLFVRREEAPRPADRLESFRAQPVAITAVPDRIEIEGASDAFRTLLERLVEGADGAVPLGRIVDELGLENAQDGWALVLNALASGVLHPVTEPASEHAAQAVARLNRLLQSEENVEDGFLNASPVTGSALWLLTGDVRAFDETGGTDNAQTILEYLIAQAQAGQLNIGGPAQLLKHASANRQRRRIGQNLMLF